MPEQDLIKYIQSEQRHGLSHEAIVEDLLKSGIRSSEIIAAFKKLETAVRSPQEAQKPLEKVARRPKIKLLLILLVILIIVIAGLVALTNLQRGVVTRVGGRAITKQDLANYDRLYNAVRRFQQTATSSVQLTPRDEVLKSLIEQTLIESEAQKRGLSVSSQEIQERKNLNALALLPLYGWSDQDYEQSIKNQLLREKLEDALITWREAEFIAIRFDTLPQGHADKATLQPKAKALLAQVQDDFASGKSGAEITEALRTNEEYLKDFIDPATVQLKILPPDQTARRYARITDPLAGTVDEHIIKMRVPTKSEIFCIEAACYLIRVSAGNDGSYQTLGQWLKNQKL